ncbi:centrosomal protein of 57 kDa-like [Acanthaster planci]|uniref:Centrosomal protein of 57 kDa-like n=1 Tax=Acanthaster planci TaxID=133434 RepID=A0A8B7Y9C4_ACAPL|nr:centrosomal protein of 57 kDa-like [Acanthaster planci]
MTSAGVAPESISSYQDYPSNLSLISDRYPVMRTPKRVNSAAESNNRAVISALLGLQEKIRRLEEERTEAEGNLKSLATETAHYRDLMKRQRAVKQTSDMPGSKETQELQGQLASAESRSQLLEKQLEYMRNMVRSAEQARDSALRQQELQSMQLTEKASEQVRVEEEKIRELEREQVKLKATQALAESKLQDLENKVKEEKHHREMQHSKEAHLQYWKVSDKALQGTSNKVKKPKKKKGPSTSIPASSKVHVPSHSKRPCSSRHLRLKMENVPFVAGKAVTPSHNVNVNMQSLIALMKTHHSAWCGNASVKKQPNRLKAMSKKSQALSSGTSSDSDLSDLLLGLQDEFGQLALEHQELTKQIQQTAELQLQDQLEQELAQIFSRMEAKGEQINKLKKHKQKIAKKVPNYSAKPKLEGRGRRSPSVPSRDGEVKVITTVTTKGSGIKTKSFKVITPDTKSNQRVLHNMKTLQTSLCKDDVTWD